MGGIHSPDRVKLIAGLISNDPEMFSRLKRPLERLLKNLIDYESPILDFDKTSYYKEEMGPGLKRIFFGFKDLIGLDGAYKIKIKTNALERKLSKCGKRTVNIDPGYLDMAKLVLFSTKDYTHRIHLNKGIYAEVTLHYKNGAFDIWPWTYPDYQSREYREIFENMRGIYKKQTRSPDMLIKTKSLIVALLSSFLIALVLLLTLASYLIYMELKTRESESSYQKLMIRLKASERAAQTVGK
jgi:hypothetical protein